MSTFRGFIIAAAVTGIAALFILLLVSRNAPEAPVSHSRVDPSIPSAEQSAKLAPAFDIVRVDERGIAVLAGSSEPGAEIFLMHGKQELANVTSGTDGNWSMVPDHPLPVGEIELHLVASHEDGTELRSKHTVVVSVPLQRDRKPLVVLGAPGGPSKVLQDPNKLPALGALVLETIDYDREGGVIFAGKAKPGLVVRVFADGKLTGETRADENGRWVVTSVAPLSVGVHNLQIDQVEPTGRVSAVLALPFERADPSILGSTRASTVVVQPGHSLWRIARSLYGEGLQYTIIYSANQHQIRDPDLIYPGQVLDIP